MNILILGAGRVGESVAESLVSERNDITVVDTDPAAHWAESAKCDATRVQSFYGLQDLAFRAVLESGDCFVLRRAIARPVAVEPVNWT